MDYYVYILGNPFTGLPFYVGIAKITKYCPIGFRPKRHIREAIVFQEQGKLQRGANRHKLYTILQILSAGKEVLIDIHISGLSHEEAISTEIRLIQTYGRKDLGNGSLTNLTDGGEGGFNMSIEGRRRISELLKNRPSPHKGRKLGPYSKERAQKAGDGVRKYYRENPDALKGRKCKPLSESHKKKLSESLKGRPSPMKGRSGYVSWNKGKKMAFTDQQREQIANRNRSRKGIQSIHKGKSYIEIYGEEKALETKKKKDD